MVRWEKLNEAERVSCNMKWIRSCCGITVVEFYKEAEDAMSRTRVCTQVLWMQGLRWEITGDSEGGWVEMYGGLGWMGVS